MIFLISALLAGFAATQQYSYASTCSSVSDCYPLYGSSGRCQSTTACTCNKAPYAASGQCCDQSQGASGTVGCAVDGGCMGNMQCSDTAGNVCTSNNCNSYQYKCRCAGSTNSNTGQYCTYDSQCTSYGQSCISGRCTASNNGQYCSYDSQCTISGQRCVSGRCSASGSGQCSGGSQLLSTTLYCSSSSQCASLNGACIGGRCCGCLYDYQCDLGRSCTSGRCVASSNSQFYCDANRTPSMGQCVSGLCPAGSSCRSSAYTITGSIQYGVQVCCLSTSSQYYCDANRTPAVGMCSSGYCPTGQSCRSSAYTISGSIQYGVQICCSSAVTTTYFCDSAATIRAGFACATNPGVCTNGYQCSSTLYTSYNVRTYGMSACCAGGSTGVVGQYNGPCMSLYSSTNNPSRCYNGYACRRDAAGAEKCMCPEGKGIQSPGSTYCVDLKKLAETCYKNEPEPDCGVRHSYCKFASGATSGVCDCATTFGYIKSSDSKSCVRGTAKFGATCAVNADCMNAFSTCDTTTKKCACVAGFQSKDYTMADGTKVTGCAPTAMKCPDGSDPIQVNSAPKDCEKEIAPMNANLYSQAASSSYVTRAELRCAAVNSNLKDNCGAAEYCNAYYDDPNKTNVRKGFCCKEPAEAAPKCPVGDYNPKSKKTASDGSVSYDCDCGNDEDYFCHTDPRKSPYSVCCPKACPNPFDTYKDGNCYPRAYYSEACDQDSQCITNPAGSTTAPTPPAGQSYQNLVCYKADKAKPGVCQCPNGALYANNMCIRVDCSARTGTTVYGTSPESDSAGKVITCFQDGSDSYPYTQTPKPAPPKGIVWGQCTGSPTGSTVKSTCTSIGLMVSGVDVGVCCKKYVPYNPYPYYGKKK